MPASSADVAGGTDRLAAARLWATSRYPYLASALFAARVRPNDGCPGVAVDRRWNIHANPDLARSLDVPELGALLVHLVGHLVRDHAERADRVAVEQREWWNRCGDAEINDDLEQQSAVPTSAPDLPGDLNGQPFQFAEAYYELPSTGPRRWDCGSGADGEPRPWDCDGIPQHQCEHLRLTTAQEIKRCHGQQPGSVPVGWVRWAEAILPSKLDWRRVLAAEIKRALALSAGRVDYSYQRRSRRAETADEVILPALVHPTPRVAIVCDTSGSMHEQLLARALAEIDAILSRAGLRQGHVYVLAVDTAVHAVSRVTNARQVELLGGGGTDMGQGIRAALELRPRPSTVIVLTDGYTPWPQVPPRGCRVIIGLLRQRHPYEPATPDWARSVAIDT